MTNLFKSLHPIFLEHLWMFAPFRSYKSRKCLQSEKMVLQTHSVTAGKSSYAEDARKPNVQNSQKQWAVQLLRTNKELNLKSHGSSTKC